MKPARRPPRFALWPALLAAGPLALLGGALAQDMATGRGRGGANIHWSDQGCSVCHTDPDFAAITAQEAEAACRRCHPNPMSSVHVHPIDVQPDTLADPIERRGIPLVAGRLACISCHDVLVQCEPQPGERHTNRAFLRGPEGGSVMASCFLCHTEDTYERDNPHIQVTADGHLREESCTRCHTDVLDPNTFRPGDDPQLVSPTNPLCLSCHIARAHPRGTDHLTVADEQTLQRMVRHEVGNVFHGMTASQVRRYLALRALEPRSLPLGPGNLITCITCHSAHEAGVLPPGSPLATEVDTPHRLRLEGDLLCQVCHDM